ncbi:hypothetical protein SCB71_07760 [Herbiconiux sp. KACC 21604]|uniref:hypothetical protein n=1 Tax=unclassified Herbiconiux TaxID=2618217 RepID=UPI001491C32E|nr:hypothetical protein [Herbiconiux sp. SALV-R1]QJU53175.1 hypothetical protein HL652_05725 [Herbiconiux sp. SALV-R1]WPO88122.1 hypothetical protein SCB71_07760 [Herbiconiux sp. KACC 21604]
MTTRDLLDGRRRRPRRRARVAVIVSLAVVVALAAGAAFALWWLPPVLAETPRERLVAATTVTVFDDEGSASVVLEPGWLAIGVGPFLPTATATLESPDDAYRATFGLSSPEEFDAAALLDSLGFEEVAATSGAAEPATPGATPPATPGATPPAVPDELAWSEETLTSGAVVRYADVVRGDTTVTVASVSAPADDPHRSVLLTLVASTPTANAARYRTVTAQLLSSVTFGPPGHPTASPSASPAETGAPR